MQQRSDIHPLERLVRRLGAHSRLSAADVNAIKGLPHRIAHQRPYSWIVREGDEMTSCCVLVSGYVHRSRLTEAGERQILAVYVPGDPIDFDHLFLPTADDSLQAVRDVVVARIDVKPLRDLLTERPGIAEAVTRALMVDASVFREWILNIGCREALPRIAHLFCELALRMEVQGFIASRVLMPLTQEQIADATGLTSVHVNRTLKAMTTKRLVARHGAQVMISDLATLQSVAGFDSRYLHIAS